MPKKTQKKMVQKNVQAIKVLTEGELQGLAHAGTKEAIEKIEKYLQIEEDVEKRAYAQLALEECELFYYQARNERENEEFMLCELIRRREENIMDLMMEEKDIDGRLEKLTLEKKVHEKVLAMHKNKKKDWEYNWLSDFMTTAEDDLKQIKDQIAYEEAWIEEAKKMITTERYKKMPDRHLEHFDFNFGEKFSEDEEDLHDDDCDCCDDPPF
jgi:hypothetical protein